MIEVLGLFGGTIAGLSAAAIGIDRGWRFWKAFALMVTLVAFWSLAMIGVQALLPS